VAHQLPRMGSPPSPWVVIDQFFIEQRPMAITGIYAEANFQRGCRFAGILILLRYCAVSAHPLVETYPVSKIHSRCCSSRRSRQARSPAVCGVARTGRLAAATATAITRL